VSTGSRSEFRIDGRRALVTGASRGIGRAIAIGLARNGAHVLLHYNRDRDAANSALQTIQSSGGSATLMQQDLLLPNSGALLAARATESETLDILVINVAIQEREDLAEISYESFMRHVNANLWSALQLIQAVIPEMERRRWGRILHIGSVQQVRPNPNLMVYAGLKCALSNAMRGISKAYASSGITANTLAPGLIDTDRTTDLKSNPTLFRSILDRIPIGEAGTPDDCVGAALLLCSDAGRYITGIDLLVDGGMHIP
jgi:NAD(P)-dependent dehydrogenase (short-subunit alcohol dehydrogenase family)